MSDLERFIRIRHYRGLAAEYRHLSEVASPANVRVRYLTVANHYNALAALEVRSDRRTRGARLARLRSERERGRLEPSGLESCRGGTDEAPLSIDQLELIAGAR
jgi:hypothetical protein